MRQEDALQISRETLLRLHDTRPDHKQVREKFDPKSASDLKNNKTMTFEDNIHQGTVETFFKTSLRPEHAGAPATKKPSAQNEPCFFGEDMDRWLTKKFSNAQKARQEFKNSLGRSGQFVPFGTANKNAKRPELKRRYSRCSAPSFINVDFNYTGNSNDIHHLITHAKGPKNHAPSDLNFELNLRTWRPQATALK